MLFRRWADSTGLRSTLRSFGANSGFARVGLLVAPLGRTSLRPAEPAHPRCLAARQRSTGSAGRRFAKLRAPRQRTRCIRRRLCLPQSTTLGRNARCTAPCRRLLNRVRRGRERPTLGEPPPGAPPRGELSGGAEELQPSYPENPSSTERSSTGWSAASVASWSQRSFSGCPACPFTHTKRTE